MCHIKKRTIIIYYNKVAVTVVLCHNTAHRRWYECKKQRGTGGGTKNQTELTNKNTTVQNTDMQRDTN